MATQMDWTATRNDIIKQALWNIGVVPYGEEPDPEQLSIAKMALNAITKHLQNSHIPLWNFSDLAIATIASTAYYAVTNADAVFIDTAWLTISSNTVDLDIYDREYYYSLTDRGVTTGQPTGVFFDRNIATPAVYVYPIPDAVYALTCRLGRRLRDWDSATDNSLGDTWPSWWIEPIIWKLAANLSHTFRLPLNERVLLEKKAEELIKSVQTDNFKQNDRGEVKFYAD
jgi:hypothetical protein